MPGFHLFGLACPPAASSEPNEAGPPPTCTPLPSDTGRMETRARPGQSAEKARCHPHHGNKTRITVDANANGHVTIRVRPGCRGLRNLKEWDALPGTFRSGRGSGQGHR